MNTTKKKHKQKSGFTLIELLIVIAIIGILASIVLVSLTNARTKAREAKYVAYVSSMSDLVEGLVYAGDFDGEPYMRGCLGLSESGHCWGGSSYWETSAYRARIDSVLGNGVSTKTVPMSPANGEYGLIMYHCARGLSWCPQPYVKLHAFVGSGNMALCDKFGWHVVHRYGGNVCVTTLYY